MQIHGVAREYQLIRGDVFFISQPSQFTIATSRSARVLDGTSANLASEGGTVDLGGDAIRMIAGHVDLRSESAVALLQQMPPAIHVSANASSARSLAFLIEQLAEEFETKRSGWHHAAQAIAQMIFLHALRSRISDATDTPPGWLRVLSNPRLARALTAIHREPKRAWTLNDLADVAVMSRTSFAVHFKAAAGTSPLSYLTEWRMRLAENELRQGKPIAEVSAAAGYGSDAAFSTAFKRVLGTSPALHRRHITNGGDVRLAG